ncbi:MAG: dUTP diphosphatase [Acidobacteria bacterium]|nr:dUTP diphosphatase [Acidobacteriota bacterium]
MEIRIKRLPNGVGLPLPAHQSEGAAGMDLHAAVESDVTLEPGKIKLIPCGFAVAIPHGFEGQIRPRSGLVAKHGITVANSPGTIDPDYRGEVKVLLINHGTAPFLVSRGMRIAQILISPVECTEWKEVEDLPITRRGEGGYGHTGA